MEVTVIQPLHEDGRDYRVGDRFPTTPSRGWRLAELGLVDAPPPWKYDYGAEWVGLRKLIGARPGGILAFDTRRSRLDALQPGEKLLLLRKYGGLGDILIQSMLFPMLRDQYPEVEVTYAVPRQFHPLFEGSGVACIPYEEVFGEETCYHRGTVRPVLLQAYDLIEDLSIPCHIWENFFVAYGGIEPGSGLRWRNRLDMWARWFGLMVKRPRTCITLREEERAAARALLRSRGNGKPTAILSPFAANRTKSYPWVHGLMQGLETIGYRPLILHHTDIPNLPVLAGLSYRMMGAVCALADLIVTVDTSTFHWGGILRRPTFGLFNVNDGAAYSRYYPTAVPLQLCDSPCINVRYGNGDGTCPKLAASVPHFTGSGLALSRCYRANSVARILEAVQCALMPR